MSRPTSGSRTRELDPKLRASAPSTAEGSQASCARGASGGLVQSKSRAGNHPRLVCEGQRPVQKENSETRPQLAAPYRAPVTDLP